MMRRFGSAEKQRNLPCTTDGCMDGWMGGWMRVSYRLAHQPLWYSVRFVLFVLLTVAWGGANITVQWGCWSTMS